MTMCEHLEGLGVTPVQLEPGTKVMVPVGQGNAMVNGEPCIIAMATVTGPASEQDAAVFQPEYGVHVYWLNVHMGPGIDVPQMYQARQILGVPALGLTMAGQQ